MHYRPRSGKSDRPNEYHEEVKKIDDLYTRVKIAPMKKIYYSRIFPIISTMELNHTEEMSEHLLTQEIKRLIEQEQEQVAINQAMDLLIMPERPLDKKELLNLIMQTDEIQELLMETKGQMEEADEDMKHEYQEKTFYSFLIDLTNWLETR